jgi:putative transposase
MKYNPEIHNRRSIRLKGYDYSKAGLYFITICVQDHKMMFGEVIEGEMVLNDPGNMLETEWKNLKTRFPIIKLHEFIVMPNHFHGILEIVSATEMINQTVGSTLVVDHTKQVDHINQIDHNDQINRKEQVNKNEKGNNYYYGQPQGIAPTYRTDKNTENQGINPTCRTEKNTENQGIAPTIKTVGDIIAAFKSITTVEYIRGVKKSGWKPFNRRVWQRNYYEIIMRTEQSYINISNYIINNPRNWKEDKFNK